MISYDDFKKLDLRVAEVKSAREHPNADKLLILEVDLGSEVKQIVAGIRSSYAKEDLVGRKIIVLNNLEPAVLRGETSNGMLLAASAEGSLPVLLSPEKDVPAGSRVK